MTIKNKMKRSGAAIALLGSVAGVGSAMAPSASAADTMPGGDTIVSCQRAISTASTPCKAWYSESYSEAREDLRRSVRNIQYQLNLHGIKVATDGVYGPGTKAAVIKAQKYLGITPDGVVGPRTVGALHMHYYVYAE